MSAGAESGLVHVATRCSIVGLEMTILIWQLFYNWT